VRLTALIVYSPLWFSCRPSPCSRLITISTLSFSSRLRLMCASSPSCRLRCQGRRSPSPIGWSCFKGGARRHPLVGHVSRAALAVTHWLVMFQVFTVELLFPLLSSTFTAPRCLFLVSWFPRLIVIIVIHVSCSPHALPRGTGSSQVVCDTPDALRVGACGAVGCGGRTLDDRRRVCCEYHARRSTFSPAVLHSGKDRLYTSTSPRPPVPPPPPVLLRHLWLANSSNGRPGQCVPKPTEDLWSGQSKLCGDGSQLIRTFSCWILV